MYIEKIHVKNFRRIGNSGINMNCNKGINILLGENNSGKTAIIDALRLALKIGEYKKNLYVKPSDFHIDQFGEQADTINIDIYFNDLTQTQAIAFYMLTNGSDLSKAELHIEYSLYIDRKGGQRVREDVKGGPAFNSVPREVFDNINLLYLAALRDAEYDLRPSKNSQLANILYSVAKTDDEKVRLVKVLEKANIQVADDASIKKVENIINKNLHSIEKDELHEAIKVSLLPPSFEAIAASVRIDYINNKLLKIDVKRMTEILDDLGIDKTSFKEREILKYVKEKEIILVDLEKMHQYEEYSALYEKLVLLIKNNRLEVSQNGLGYNNILHMASSLGDLQERPIEEEISILLVEEPEAHLHPQLLDLVFEFFKKADKESKIQIFITSHSPSLVAKADIDSVHILYTKQENNWITSIKNTALDENEKMDLKRYLDVTKSQMFFARRIIFVEGISEAILINEFAKLLNKPLDKYSVEIVNVNGVAFEPFAKLFSKKEEKERLRIPCTIISDNDKCTNNDDPYQIKKEERVYSKINVDALVDKLEHGEISYRAKNLLAYNCEEICVKLAEKTLEYELAKIKENVPLLLEILKEEHSDISEDIKRRSCQKKNDGTDNEEYETEEKIALRIWIAIQDCKGSFAQRLANEINKISESQRQDIQFKVPAYICEAIDSVLR